MRRSFALLTLILVSIAAARPSAPTPAAPAASALESIAPLKPFAGEWVGAGWIAFPPDKRTTIRTTTTAGLLGDGAYFMIEERAWGRVGDDPAAPETLLHNALTVFNFDPATTAVAVRLYEVSIGAADGTVMSDPVMVTQLYKVPGRGQFRLTMMKTDTGWRVLGHESADGGIWTQSLEVNYAKKN